MEVRTSRASAVVIQRVPASGSDWFMEWQRGISEAAEAFAGYRGSDVYPPAESRMDPWVIVIHFDDDESLQAWLNSGVRSHWVEKLREEVGDFELKLLQGGFGSWFTGITQHSELAIPPPWKMAMAVLVGLYPTVMLLSLVLEPLSHHLGQAVTMLIGNALSVAILQWAVMPMLNIILGPWFNANSYNQRSLSVSGFLIMVAILAGMALIFKQAFG